MYFFLNAPHDPGGSIKLFDQIQLNGTRPLRGGIANIHRSIQWKNIFKRYLLYLYIFSRLPFSYIIQCYFSELPFHRWLHRRKFFFYHVVDLIA